MQTLRASTLGLTAEHVSSAVLDIIDTLSQAGFDAYIVGGGVRDLLLGLHPKDFDVVTNATPTQIREVFGKRCRIVGRRFELAHVYSGRDMIEVATFRAPPRHPKATGSGMIMRDNVWGSIEQDFARRDFSINSLYYQPRKNKLLDFCQALDDLNAKTLRFLGNPVKRVEEDPVRLLRVLRFMAKLGFALDDGLAAVLTPAMTQLLADVSPHRLYDETQKMFVGGYLAPLIGLLIEHHVWPVLFGQIPAKITPLIERAANNTDQRIAAGKSINPAFFYAVLLWQPMCERVQTLIQKGMNAHEAWTQAGVDVLRRQQQHTAIPRYAEVFIREVWELQPRLIEPKARQIPALSQHPRFRAGFDFLYLREQSGDTLTQGMGQWWHDYQELDTDSKEKAISRFNRQQLREKKQQHTQTAPMAEAVVDEPIVLLPNEPVRKPRRRNDKNTSMTQDIDQRARAEGGRRRRRPRDLSTVFMGPYT